jgi:hypothetical protein
MSSTVMMERTGMGMPGLGVPGLGTPQVGAPSGMPSAVMVPRCTFKVEKCQGGFKIHCDCDDPHACATVQNLCAMLVGGMCSYCVMFNGMTVNYTCLTMGMCKYETTDKGVCITCTSGDPKCCEMIQSCCDCLSCMLKDGCTCCVMINHMPIACGTTHEYASSPAKKATK